MALRQRLTRVHLVRIPEPLRAPLTRVAAASAGDSASDLAAALGAVIAVSRKHLDEPSLAELDEVAQRLADGGA